MSEFQFFIIAALLAGIQYRLIPRGEKWSRLAMSLTAALFIMSALLCGLGWLK